MENIDIIKQIGKGSFSNVYLCKDEDGFDYIIKEININTLVQKYMLKHKTNKQTVTYVKRNTSKLSNNITPYDDETLIIKENEYYYRRLKQLIDSEIEILKEMSHINIIHFYEYTKQYGVYYLNMEYCEKGDVYDILKNNNEYKRNIYNGMTNEFIYEFIKQITDGLKYIFDKNLIHRDIKLHNILVSNRRNGIIFKISDFGFACYDMSKYKEDEINNESSYLSMGSNNTNKKNIDSMEQILMKKYYKLCGTPYYMAPELIKNMNLLEDFTQYEEKTNDKHVFYNNKIDLWSYGICIYELVFNKLPFPLVKNIKELEIFYKQDDFAGQYIHKQIDKYSIDKHIKNILLMLMQIKMELRSDIHVLKEYICKHIETTGYTKYTNKDTINTNTEIKIDIDELNNIINSDKNVYVDMYKEQKEHYYLKQHIVSRPLKKDSVLESWEELVNYDSILKNKSIEKGFLEWLLK